MEKIEKIKEDWHMLLSLGFTKEDRAVEEELIMRKGIRWVLVKSYATLYSC